MGVASTLAGAAYPLFVGLMAHRMMLERDSLERPGNSGRLSVSVFFGENMANPANITEHSKSVTCSNVAPAPPAANDWGSDKNCTTSATSSSSHHVRST